MNSEDEDRSGTDRMTDFNWPSETLPGPPPSRGRWDRPQKTLVAWLGALSMAGAAWVSAIANGPLLFELLGVTVAISACLGFGAQIGYRNNWGLFGIAIMGATVVVVLSASAAWFSMFFVPVPGGSGGVFEIIGLPLLIAFAGLPLIGAIAVVLGLGAFLGLAFRKVRS